MTASEYSGAIRAVTLDLDDTLWPFAPVAARIREALDAFLAEHAPQTAARYEQAAVDEALAAVRKDRDDLANDIGALRRAVLAHLLAAAGEDPALADPAFEVIFAARQQIELYPDSAAALDRLAARVPLLAITNGNADLELTGVARWFVGCVAAHDVGVAKPHPAVFGTACERLGLPPGEILHAGDDLETDVGGALAAGFQVVWVQRELVGAAPTGAHTVPDLAALADLVEAAGQGPTTLLAARLDDDRFPGDPGDRLIYATAVQTGARLLSRDERLRAFDAERTVW